jgi:hypothetical protein
MPSLSALEPVAVEFVTPHPHVHPSVALFAFLADYRAQGDIRCAVVYTAHNPEGALSGYHVVWDALPEDKGFGSALVPSLDYARVLIELTAPHWAAAYADVQLPQAA